MTHSTAMDSVFIRTRIFMFSEFYSFCFFLFYMHDKSYSSGLFLCIPIRERELSVTVELSKPQLRMVDLNLLTVFDAVMQEQNITRAAHVSGNVATCGQ
ncbi:leucine transcriptional activator [Escherichia coli]|nr:leucine transcriptional activator [Escherichia coli]